MTFTIKIHVIVCTVLIKLGVMPWQQNADENQAIGWTMLKNQATLRRDKIATSDR